ncbi:MAG: ATP-dependent helicase [Thermoguttaceae bacterium]
MGQVQAFLGPAGSGKTYALMNEVERLCSISTFQPAQSILAITFMHGSRRRLAARLHACSTNGVRTQCETIDSFCLRIVNRFRWYLNKNKPISIQDEVKNDKWLEGEREWKASFRAIRKAAITLLQHAAVRSSIGFTYPVIIVDEFQDCVGELLELVGLLSAASSVIVAADDFQHLSNSETCPACEWLRDQKAEVIPLSGNRRTSDDVLLETATALRSGDSANSSIEVHLPDSPALIAWQICSRLAWKKIPTGNSMVLISPVRLGSSPWLQGVCASLEKGFEEKWKFHPRPFHWESGEEEQYDVAVLNAQINIEQGIARSTLCDLERSDDQIVRLAASQGRRRISLRGETVLESSEFLDILKKATHSASVFRRGRQNARIATTVHGAKNREFDYVFIAWPYKVQNDNVLKRKLLYNAVTRAKKGAILFVQGGEKRIKDDAVLRLLECGIVKKKVKQSKSSKKSDT